MLSSHRENELQGIAREHLILIDRLTHEYDPKLGKHESVERKMSEEEMNSIYEICEKIRKTFSAVERVYMYLFAEELTEQILENKVRVSNALDTLKNIYISNDDNIFVPPFGGPIIVCS